MANTNLGFLSLGEVAPPNGNNRGRLQRSGPGIRTDTYTFDTGSTVANVAASVNSQSGRDIALVLFKDNNADLVLNAGDTVVKNAGNGGTFQTVNSNLPRGNYIVRLTSATDTDYIVRIARASTGSANPLTAPEIPLGTIAQDLQRRNSVNDADNADNFAFTLDGNSSLNINVKELGNKKGDVNIRVVQDLDSDGVVDADEVVMMGVSSRNSDAIAGLKGAGDYILQVCQSKGSSRFEVNFDHSAA
jgi:hypothetical protein